MNQQELKKLREDYQAKKAAERQEFDHLYASSNILDEDGYPSSTAIRVIELWPIDLPTKLLFDYIDKIWAMKYFGWHVQTNKKGNTEYHLSTAGWSGNEAIIKAIQNNTNFVWDEIWMQSSRGGHYIFEISE